MEQSIHRYFIDHDEVKSTCDFIPERFQYKLPIYEVIRVIQGKPLFFDDHLQRMEQSMLLSGYQQQLSKKQLHHAVKTLIQINEVEEGNIYIQSGMTTNSSILRYACWWIPHRYPDAIEYRNGVNTVLSLTSRIEPNAKVYREDYKKQQRDLQRQQNAFETLLYDSEGITEGSRSNVFFVVNSTLITAPDHAVLKGITRQKVIELSEKIDIPVVFRKLPIAELHQVDGAFISGTSPKILPIRSVDSSFILNTQHPMIEKLRNAFNACIKFDLDSFSWLEEV